MTNQQLDPGDLDADVLRALSALPGFAPSPSFADRVMARVSLPRPAAVVLAQRAALWLSRPRRVAALAAAYGFSLLVVLSVAVPWIGAHSWLLDTAAADALAHARLWLDGAVVSLAAWAVRSGLGGALRFVGAAGPALWAGVAAASLAYAAGGWGLHRLLKAPAPAVRRDADVAR